MELGTRSNPITTTTQDQKNPSVEKGQYKAKEN